MNKREARRLAHAITVAERIRLLIDTSGWTQEEAAAELGVSRFSVNQLMQGRRTLTPTMAIRLAMVFDVPAEALLKAQMREDLAAAREELEDWIIKYDKTRGRRNT